MLYFLPCNTKLDKRLIKGKLLRYFSLFILTLVSDPDIVHN